MSNAHNLLTKRLYKYIHRKTKRVGESEMGIFCLHEGQFICTDDMQGWLFFALSAQGWCYLAAVADIAKVCAGSVEDWLKPGQAIILLWLYPSYAWFFFPLLSVHFISIMPTWQERLISPGSKPVNRAKYISMRKGERIRIRQNLSHQRLWN